MVLEVIKFFSFPVNEIKTDNAVIESLALRELTALIAAAGENRVDEENWKANNHKNWVL